MFSNKTENVLFHDNNFFFIFQNDVIGKDCKLTEPIYGTEYDLNQMHSELGHKINVNDNDFIQLNICGNMTTRCAGSDVTACFHENGNEIKFGIQQKKTNVFNMDFCHTHNLYLIFGSFAMHNAGLSSKNNQPIYTQGRVYMNYTGDSICKKSKQPYTLLIVMICDYSSHISNPITLMPYVSFTFHL